MMTFASAVAEQLRHITDDPQFETEAGLVAALRLLAKWRSKLIDNTIVARHGTTIQAGPFKDMEFVANASECNVSPRLLGSYEAELHGLIEEIISTPFQAIVDIGCADGYYAVGFARRMPTTHVFAFDINPLAQEQCRDLAERNGVGDRVTIGGEFRGEDFASYAAGRTLVFIDAEGAEDDLIRPDRFTALQTVTVLVECHDVFKPGLSHRMAERFAGTHDVRRIEPRLHCPSLPDWFSQTSHLDQLLAAWEWRSGPTPWLYLTPRRGV